MIKERLCIINNKDLCFVKQISVSKAMSITFRVHLGQVYFNEVIVF